MTNSHEDQPSPSKCNGGQLLKMSVQESRYYHVVEWRRSCRFSAAEADDADEQEPCAGADADK